MKKLLLLSISALFILACHSGSKEVTTTQVKLQSVTLGLMPTMDGFPFIVAHRQGIYDSLGLEVNLVRFNSANDRDAALQAGRIDGMITDYPSAVLLQLHHPGLAVIMENNGYFCFISSKKSGVNQSEQLKKKSIAISRGTVIEYATDLFCTKSGIKTEEINKPEIAQIPLRLNMLEYGQIEASFLPDPFATIAMNDGNRSLISTRELNIHLTGTAFTEAALKEKKAEITSLIQGYNLGVKYIQTHSSQEVSTLLAEEFRISENLARLILLPSYTPASRPNIQEINNTLKWLKEKNRIPAHYQGENLIDTTFTVPYKIPSYPPNTSQ
ncbi:MULTISPECIES: ABC transporter substrate-binding protein [Bacteroides]|jgi:NitT/TauT family transport system substrate-binding protein|uniref:SsuA/THI5-like domain-containing protein n=2 Tax=Bacteroides nordii TaxID=291645 RepID=I8XD39_9BACE|nr:ABC transporter substrate-binding protein [Bacteroides nordii]DAZ20044.1 MAG TPA: hypothetical protein [Caudoviricetes sp.]EIY48007.1 hypothetical protein HMPREF1068_03086 [Bacteroides nordii CL02T12C05]MCE8465841.1 ABC transporter substrate-binding protein [Bacteroides nordii]MCG4768948.1 MetQ/NlpA family ABC transporter substrate-binding protein [Bacteroides nordii]RHB38605.1 thiamine biosynthesis protein [Bacteroides nordii]